MTAELCDEPVREDLEPVESVAGSTSLADLLARPGTRAVLLAGSRDPHAKLTLVLLDAYGPGFVVKVPTTATAADVVRTEGTLLGTLHGHGLGSLAATLPRPAGYVTADGLDALVTGALPGRPMTVSYHTWRHTARRRRVRADFVAAGDWLAELQRRSAGPRAPVTMFGDALDAIDGRFGPQPDLRERLDGPAAALAGESTPRTVVHGDYWYGNLLVADNRVRGVVDWEAGALVGEPLRDVARFAVSYALYLDRHTRPGRPVAGHSGLRADDWGAGLTYALTGTGWFPDLVARYVTDALTRLGADPRRWRDVLLAGVAEVAATADHPEFARAHLDLLARLPEVPA